MSGTGSKDRSRLKEYLLVLRSQAGDEGAFSVLFDRFGARTLRYLEGVLGPDAAADAQQEVWVAVYRRISGVTNPGAFRTWLYQITRHRAVDALRREKRESELLAAVRMEDGEPPVESSDGSPGPPNPASLEAGMAELSVAHREVLLLRYHEEMTYADIALISGCSVGTVRSRLHHAKRRLRDALSRQAAEESQGIPSDTRKGETG